MYLKHMIYENIGPIDRIDIKPSFDEKNEPIPMIIVGENGTGKSILLSNIVDSLYELAAKYYTNAERKSAILLFQNILWYNHSLYLLLLNFYNA